MNMNKYKIKTYRGEPDKTYIGVRELMKLTGRFSYTTIYKWRNQNYGKGGKCGPIPVFRIGEKGDPGTRYLYPLEDVQKWYFCVFGKELPVDKTKKK